jgi:hypothetical protein
MELRKTLARKQTNYVKVEYVTHLRVFWRLMLVFDLIPNCGPDNVIGKFYESRRFIIAFK